MIDSTNKLATDREHFNIIKAIYVNHTNKKPYSMTKCLKLLRSGI
jgi:hypothetical protein